jgi:capsular polysaccharide biosynthesis protein
MFNVLTRIIRTPILRFFTRISRLLPLWKEAEYIDIIPPLLSLPVSLPVNLEMLPTEFASKFIKVKSIAARRISILRNVYVNGQAVVFKNMQVFTPSLAWLKDIDQFRKADLLLKQWKPGAKYIPDTTVAALVYDDWSASNYYHWMIESLPKLIMIKHAYPDCLLIVPDEAPGYIVETIRLMSFNNLYLLPRDWSAIVKVSRLVLPEQVYYEEDEEYLLNQHRKRPVSTNKLPVTGAEALHGQELISLVQQKLLQHFTRPSKAHRKIFISRSKQKLRRLVNEEEVLVVLEKYGFEMKFFEEMGFHEQLQLMQETVVFISVHGSNMVNMLFLQKGATVIELMNREYLNDAYYLLSSSLQLAYYSVPCTMAESITIEPGTDTVLLNDAHLVADVAEVEQVINLALR